MFDPILIFNAIKQAIGDVHIKQDLYREIVNNIDQYLEKGKRVRLKKIPFCQQGINHEVFELEKARNLNAGAFWPTFKESMFSVVNHLSNQKTLFIISNSPFWFIG